MHTRTVSPRTIRLVAYVAVAGVTFQVLHFIEHIAQLGYWFMHPTAAPWLTPWAASGRDVLAAGGSPVTGTEWLHLLGNAIFFVALVAMWMLLGFRRLSLVKYGSLKKAIGWQGFHLAEHVALTATWLMFGTAVGVSTFFGLVGGGALLSSYRVWFHFLLNLVVTLYAAKALKVFLDEKLLYPAPELEAAAAA